MNYFLDTKFLEGPQKTFFGKTKPTIDLISIGIVAEDGREYYTISKEFNFKEAWNRYQEKPNMDYKPNFGGGSDGHYNPHFIKEYWIRENVLKPIFQELLYRGHKEAGIKLPEVDNTVFTYKNLTALIKKYGKTNKQISEEIKVFVTPESKWTTDGLGSLPGNRLEDNPISFYGYYADYDWVVFCWLFGKMIDLPKGFPKFCIDLKQMIPESIKYRMNNSYKGWFDSTTIKDHPGYPKQTNEHNALADAKWNRELYNFLK